MPLMHPVNTRTIRVASAVMPIGNLFHAKQSMESTNTMIQMVSVLIIASNFFRSEQRPLLAPAGELVAAKRILWHYFTVSSCLCLSAFLGLSKNKQSFHHAVFAEPLTEKSHKNMSRIHGKDTRIEIVMRKALWSRGFRYRKNYKELPGRPDIVLTKYRIAIFCDSEFFHGKDWEVLKAKLEKGKNPDYWVRKIERNIQRDEEKDKQLNFMGWTVIHFWGKDILKNTEQCIKVIEETIFDQKLEEVDDEREI